MRIGTPDGLVVQQRHRASSAEALRRELEGKGLHVFGLAGGPGRLGVPGLRRRERITSIDFLVFNQQFATLLRAGIPVLQSLELLQRSQSNPTFRRVLAQVLEDVRSGVSLSDSFASQGGLFPRLYCATLMAGEQAGELVPVLTRYTQHSQVLEAVRRRVTSALTYPLVLVSLSLALITLLLTYVIPRFADFYLGFATELPLPTLIVLRLASFFERYLPYIAGAGVVAFPFVRRWLRGESGALFLDRVKLRIPFIGQILHLFALSQFVALPGDAAGRGHAPGAGAGGGQLHGDQPRHQRPSGAGGTHGARGSGAVVVPGVHGPVSRALRRHGAGRRGHRGRWRRCCSTSRSSTTSRSRSSSPAW